MSQKLVTESNLTAVADAIRAKTGTSGSLVFPSGFVSGIENIPTKTSEEWHQCPQLVRDYLDNVTYDPSDYSTSQIASYAPATAVSSNTKPIGLTVDSTTYYNEVPNEETPFATDDSAGTLKPLDSLRWLNTSTANVRDLGGWGCDGGTVKYGMLFRGGEPSASDKDLMVNQMGVRQELQLRGKSEAPQDYSLWGVDYTCTESYTWYSLTNTTDWKTILRTVFDCVTNHKTVYFHCSAGADRTGTAACMLEAILGVSQSDIDKDYELTCFSTGTGSDTSARRRNESEWSGLITAIKSVGLVGGLSDSFRNHAISFALSLGFTAAEINAFRAAMVDGSPDTITVSMDSYAVTNSLSDVENSNEDTSVDEYQGYTAELTPADGYNAFEVTVTMGGVDVTSQVFSGQKVNKFVTVTKNATNCTVSTSGAPIVGQGFVAYVAADSGYTMTGGTVTITMGGVDVSTYYSNGTIAIPQVTGDIVITATAVASEVTIDPNFVVGGFNHSVGNDFTTGETTSTSYTKSDVIDISNYSWLRVKNTASGDSGTPTMYVYWAGDDNVITAQETWAYESVQDKTFTIPSGATRCRFRGYADLLPNKDLFTITAG